MKKLLVFLTILLCAAPALATIGQYRYLDFEFDTAEVNVNGSVTVKIHFFQLTNQEFNSPVDQISMSIGWDTDVLDYASWDWQEQNFPDDWCFASPQFGECADDAEFWVVAWAGCPLPDIPFDDGTYHVATLTLDAVGQVNDTSPIQFYDNPSINCTELRGTHGDQLDSGAPHACGDPSSPKAGCNTSCQGSHAAFGCAEVTLVRGSGSKCPPNCEQLDKPRLPPTTWSIIKRLYTDD